jgi:hypothetical protein
MRLPKLTLRKVVSIAICLLAATGIVLSTGTVLTIDEMPSAVLPQVVAPHRASLEEAGIPTFMIDQLILGREPDRKSIALLRDSQRRAIIDFQEAFRPLSNLLRQSAEASKTSAWIMLAASSILMLTGILLYRFGRVPRLPLKPPARL